MVNDQGDVNLLDTCCSSQDLIKSNTGKILVGATGYFV